MSELRSFRFMESWLDDIEDWSQEEKNEAIWRIINYGIYREDDTDQLPGKERSWYKNVFRVIDKGGAISAENSERGKIGGKKHSKHNHDMIPEAINAGCKTAKEVAEYIEGEGADPQWVYKSTMWKNWKDGGIPMETVGNSNGKELESNGKTWDF